MHPFDIKLFTISAVLFAAITAVFIVFFDVLHEREKHQRLKSILLYYFTAHIVTVSGYLFYFYNPHAFIYINALFFAGMLCVPVFFYEFIFNITTTSSSEKFSKYHYLTPILLAICLLVCMIITPQEEQMNTIQGNGTFRGDSTVFYLLSNKLFFRLPFTIVYIILSFKRLPPYRKYIADYSANETKSSLWWVNILLFFMIGLMLVPLHGIFITRSALAKSFVTYLQSGMLIIQYAILVFHVVKRHYILQESQTVTDEKENNEVLQSSSATETVLKKTILSKDMLDCYMEKHKPYLDANIKITDLAESIGINRTYISQFINLEYGMNFSTYINSLRYEEYEQLRKNNTHKSLSNAELSEKVGFGSYRSLMRFAVKKKKE